MSRLTILLAATSLLLPAAIRPATAQTDASWNGGTGDWNTGANWSGGVVPGGSEFNVFIDGGKVVNSVVTGSAIVGSLTVDVGDSVLIDNSSRFGIAADPGNSSGGRLVNGGYIELDTEAQLELSGHVTLSGGGVLQLTADSSIHQRSTDTSLAEISTVGTSFIQTTLSREVDRLERYSGLPKATI